MCLCIIYYFLQEYIHRVGRTARGVGAAGNAVLLLRPEEKDFVEELQKSKIYLDKFESWNSFFNLKTKVSYDIQQHPEAIFAKVQAFLHLL